MEKTLAVSTSQVLDGGLMEASTTNYSPGEVFSNYKYPKKYKGSKPIEEQVFRIADIFGLNATDALVHATRLPALPCGAEGWFALPKLSAITRSNDEAKQYCEAVELGKKMIADHFNFNDYSNFKFTPSNFRLDSQTIKYLKETGSSQQGDIIIVAAQHGLRHRGRSVQKVRQIISDSNEFGLGFLHAFCMALTHPERYCCGSELDTECPGDEISISADNNFSHSTSFSHSGGKLGLGIGSALEPYDRFGSITAFMIK